MGDARKVSWLALFVALSAVGGMIKVPAPVASVALDSFPGLVAAVLLGPAAGAAVGALGHLASALLGGLPMGPLHGIVAAEMAGLMWLFGQLYTSGRRHGALVSFVGVNALLLPATFIPFLGLPFYISAVPALAIAALVNGAAAGLLLPRLSDLVKGKHGQRRA